MSDHSQKIPVSYKHQEEAFEKSADRINYALWMEMGTGKTKVIIDTMKWLFLKGMIRHALIIAPKGAYLNWVKELEVHMEWNYYTVMAWTSGQTPKQLDQLKRYVTCQNVSLKILLVNVEAFSTKGPIKLVEDYLKADESFVCVDESTRIKSHTALRTKALIKLGKFAKYRRVMSGSPVTKNPLDLYAQCLFLDHRLLGFTSYYAFRNQYAEIVNIKAGLRSFPKITGFKNQGELSSKLSLFSFRCLKKDCLDLPPKIYENYSVGLTPKQQELYDKFKKEAVLELTQSQTVSAPHVLTHILRLHQLVCGHVKTDQGLIVDVESDRVKILLEVLQDTGGKSIIWANYHQDISKICESIRGEFGDDSVVHYYGKTTQDERADALRKFAEVPEVRFFVGTPATGGLGLTLTSASNVVYYSNGYNLEHRLQSEDRAHRIGQTKSVTYIDLITPNTIDEKIHQALTQKKDLAKMILDDLRENPSNIANLL